MEFSRNYIGQSNETFSQFVADLNRSRGCGANKKDALTTGTTVAAFLSKDKKIGVVWSDGRVLGGTWKFTEKFRKVFDCRIGFIGCAGALGIIQRVVSAYRVDLNGICDGRGVLMTASGAVQRLFSYYLEASMVEEAVTEFIPLFWDRESQRCHLYSLRGLSKLSEDFSTTIGSGSPFIKSKVDDFNPEEHSSPESILRYAKDTLRAASSKDAATNEKFFYGLIVNGEFKEGEEVLS